MKKLIIACAAVAMAVTANAAMSSWKVTGGNLYNGTGSTDSSAKYSGTAYVFDSAVLSMSALYNAIAADSSYAIADSAVASITLANGAASNASFDYGVVGTNYSFYFAIVNGENIYFSNEIANVAALQSPTAQGLAFKSQNNNTTTFSATAPTGSGFQGAGKWSAVPEPTGAMLLLLGVAGLALRRKQR